MVVFVPWTAPGDKIVAQVTENKKRFLEAELVEILSPSKHRREPACPVFGRCGGCTWQHVEYQEQINQKDLILKSALKKWNGNFNWREFLPSPDEYRYRNRIQVNKNGSSVGFFGRGSRDIVDISDCPITEQALAEKIPSLHDRADGRYEISRRLDGSVEIESGRRSPEAALFSQVNTKQNDIMIANLMSWARELSFDHVWDLYCGSGNLTLPLWEHFPDAGVTGVELSAESIRQAQKKSSDIEWFAQDVAKFLKSQKPLEKLLVVLDPPRVGADDEVVKQLGRLKPEFVLYVSCNPMTFFRDASRLRNFGFELDRVQGFDMFPQTEHVELMSLFRPALSTR